MSHLTSPNWPKRGSRVSRTGFSLIELLVASGIAMIVMASLASLFSMFGRALSQSQATVAQAARLRAAAWKLRQDLAGLTCRVTPWLSPEAEAGYFECIEGPRKDATASDGSSNIEADTDDILMFTTRHPVARFYGRYGDANRTIESAYAEVAWFCREAGTQSVAGTRMFNLYRRQLLVIGYVGTAEFAGNAIAGSLPNNDYDLSFQLENGHLLPNTLGDLTKRENRFMHSSSQFPFELQVDAESRLLPEATFDETERVWEDVVLTNVVSFDMRAFDPEARAEVSGSTTRYPGDPGYTNGTGAFGAYVDLGAGQGGRLSRAMSPKCQLPASRPTYDTWNRQYEFNGADEDRDNVMDRGTSRADAIGDGLVAGSAELETGPPYPVPLKGIEVRIRCYDPTGRQVRQATVRQSFRN